MGNFRRVKFNLVLRELENLLSFGTAKNKNRSGPSMFTINDEWHAEWSGEYSIFAEALVEIRRLSRLSWHELPNRAPCGSWRTCGRSYEIQQYDDTTEPWTLIQSTPIVEIDAKGVRWEPDFAPETS